MGGSSIIVSLQYFQSDFQNLHYITYDIGDFERAIVLLTGVYTTIVLCPECITWNNGSS